MVGRDEIKNNANPREESVGIGGKSGRQRRGASAGPSLFNGAMGRNVARLDQVKKFKCELEIGDVRMRDSSARKTNFVYKLGTSTVKGKYLGAWKSARLIRVLPVMNFGQGQFSEKLDIQWVLSLNGLANFAECSRRRQWVIGVTVQKIFKGLERKF